MEEKQLHGQPVTPHPSDPQYVPQPLGDKPPKSNKTIWMIVAGAVGLILLLGGLYWVMANNAKTNYTEATAAYEQRIKEVRDAMNAKLDEDGVSIYSNEAPAIFEEYGEQMQAVIAGAPSAPKVLGFIPAGGNSPDVVTLTNIAQSYANQLRYINQLYEYYTTVATDFKPIKDLGSFTVRDAAKIKAVPGLWETFLTEFKALEVPPGLETLQQDLISQGEALLTQFQELADGFDSRTEAQNDALVGTLKEHTTAFNETFQQSAQTMPNDALDKVNQYYDDLDAQLQ